MVVALADGCASAKGWRVLTGAVSSAGISPPIGSIFPRPKRVVGVRDGWRPPEMVAPTPPAARSEIVGVRTGKGFPPQYHLM